MPLLNGFDLKEKLRTDATMQLKCIPYLFFTTASSKQAVLDAYAMSVQGFFVKPSSLPELESVITLIMEYWMKCLAPNHL